MSSQSSKPNKVIPQKLIGGVLDVHRIVLTDLKAIQYSLGIGFNQDPDKSEDFKYTNEFHPQFTAFPVVAVTNYSKSILKFLKESDFIPSFNPFELLHAEQKFVMVKDRIKVGAEYENETRIVDCVDKGKNAFIWFEVKSYQIVNGQRQLACVILVCQFVRGLGGFGFQGNGYVQALPVIPKTSPDFNLLIETFPNQAFLYRLTGDRNPLHIDPLVAKSVNFPKPIIHGMATYGSIARVFVQSVLQNDPRRLGSYHARFIGHVFPGEKLDLRVWKCNEISFVFEGYTTERNTRVIIGCFDVRSIPKI